MSLVGPALGADSTNSQRRYALDGAPQGLLGRQYGSSPVLSATSLIFPSRSAILTRSPASREAVSDLLIP